VSDARGAESERGAGDFVYDDIVDLLPNYGLDDFESPLIRGSTKKETDRVFKLKFELLLYYIIVKSEIRRRCSRN